MTDKSNKKEASRQAQTVAKLGYYAKPSQEKSDVGQPQALSYHKRDDFEKPSSFSRYALLDHICLGDRWRAYGEKRPFEQVGDASRWGSTGCEQAAAVWALK